MMFRNILLAAILLMSTTSALYSQAPQDTVLANRYFAIGDSLRSAGSYKDAVLYFERSAIIYKEIGDNKNYVSSLNKMAGNLWASGELDRSLKVSENALFLGEKYIGDNNSYVAHSLQNIGIVYDFKGLYKKSLECFRKSLQIKKTIFGPISPELISLHRDIGHILSTLESTDTALFHYQRALDISKKEYGEKHETTAMSYSNLGQEYETKGLYDTALIYYKKSLIINKEVLRDQHPFMASSYYHIASLYSRKGHRRKAANFYQKSLNISELSLGKLHPDIADLYNNIGSLYFSDGYSEYALSYFRKALNTWQITFGEGHPESTPFINNIGEVYLKRGNLEKAQMYFQKAIDYKLKNNLKTHKSLSIYFDNIGKVHAQEGLKKQASIYFRKALKILEYNFGINHPKVAVYYISMADVLEEDSPSEALKYLHKALNLRLNFLGEKNPKTAESYLILGDFLMRQDDYDKALIYYQKSLIANAVDFNHEYRYTNPAPGDYLHQNNILAALKMKGIALKRRYDNKRNLGDLEFSLDTYKLSDQVIDQIRRSHMRFDDKVNFGNTASDIYKEAITTSLLLYSLTDSTDYLHEAFYFSEKSKAIILHEKLSDEQAKKFTWLPDSLTNFEKELKIEKAFYYTELNKLKYQKDKYDSVKVTYHQNELFDVTRKLDSLRDSFEKNHPRYYKLKYENSILNIPDIQNQLNHEQALISYLEADELIYCFTVTKNNFSVSEIEKDSLLMQDLDRYIQSFDHDNISKQSSQNFQLFTSSAHLLYSKLLDPALANIRSSTKHLIIIPDGKLSYVPWETFIQEPPQENKSASYRDLNYLFKDFSVSYAHSASLLFTDFGLAKREYNGSVLAIAPSYPEHQNHALYSSLSPAMRNELKPLKWTGKELESISKYFNGNYFKGTQATEKVFKEKSSDYKILHLAMHALVDNENPMLSKLVFTQDKDSIEDNMLHTYELFNMNLPAHLTVLSACNTGIGKLNKGEGVMSLGRAFSYAGCPSIVMSHWSVDDQSTSELMHYFYKALSEGRSKDVAMQQARKDFLDNVPNELKAHPIYWGGFVVLGNTDPITSESWDIKYWIAGCVLLLLVLGLIIYKLKFRRS